MPSEEGRDEPKYSKPRINSRVTLPNRLSPIEWGENAIPNTNLWPRVILNIQVWLLSRDGGRSSHICGMQLCLVSEKNAGQQLWEGPEGWQTSGGDRVKPEGFIMAKVNSTFRMKWILHWSMWHWEISDLEGHLL